MRSFFAPLLIVLVTCSTSASVTTIMEPPPLPDGLQQREEKKKEPELPSGLLDNAPPSLPPGLGNSIDKSKDTDSAEQQANIFGFHFTGFGEFRSGLRLQKDPHEKAASIGEARLQLSFEKELSFGSATLTADAIYDPVLDSHHIDLETGNGWVDLREANFLMRPTSFADVKVGRQILTWGTGDLLFINDLFPKDWNAFFIGRDTEYLKAPSDAIKLALFSSFTNLDVIYTPRFDTDRFIDGQRLSYFNPGLGELAGRNAIVETVRPDEWFTDDEWAVRLYRNLGTTEVALYFYDGFWKSPAGQEPLSGLATFPRLRTYGASLRRPLFGGIAHFEAGYYESLDDPVGDSLFVANSEFRMLVGFERELMPELTGAFQYYQEQMDDYDRYLSSLPLNFPARDKTRHVLTTRITKLSMNQTLTWSLFVYYSPSDDDGYFRPKATYKLTDTWQIEAGANVFFGATPSTFFGQFEKNTNIFAGIRRSF